MNNIDSSILDSHKLMHHPDRVDEWKRTGDTRPIYIEISPTARCNLKCSFCAYGNLDRRSSDIDNEELLASAYIRNLESLKELGVWSVMLGGEGEPLLNSSIDSMVQSTIDIGIDIAMTTNGIRIWEYRDIIPYLMWIKFSVDAGTRDTYSMIKNVSPDIFDDLIYDIFRITTTYEGRGCAFGMQMIVLPENYTEVSILAKICKEIWADYLVLKPYSHHDYTDTKYDSTDYSTIIDYLDEVLPTIDYNVIYRRNAFTNVIGNIGYSRCATLPFWMYISSNGDVYPCFSYYGHEEYVIGNIISNDILDIWNSPRRYEVYDRINSDMRYCRWACRMSECNKYLEKIANPPRHVNFI